MIIRTRIFITAAIVCHVLLASRVVTSQTPPPSPLLASSAQPSDQEEVTIQAVQQEKDGPVYKLRGEVEIHYRTYILYANEVTYNSATGEADLEGHVVLDGGP